MTRLFALWLLFLPLAGMAQEWTLARNDKARDIRVYVRALPGSDYQTFYAVTRVSAPSESVLAVLSDVPAMPEWVVRMVGVRLLRRNGSKEMWLHAHYRLPYPFLDREAVLHSRLERDARSGQLTIVTRSVQGMLPPSRNKRVRLTDMLSTWKITPERDGRTRIELWGQGEPGGYVPPVLFNYNLPDEPLQTFRNLRQMLTREKYRGRPAA